MTERRLRMKKKDSPKRTAKQRLIRDAGIILALIALRFLIRFLDAILP